jgi:hypothetical protein
MSSGDLHGGSGDRTGDRLRSMPVPSGPLDPRLSPNGAGPLAPVDQNGQTARSFLRRQPAHIVAGRIEGGYTGAFEVICCDCGDDPELDYAASSPRLQRLRGPYPLLEGFTAYQAHLAMTTDSVGHEPA